jgi:hypothetical protein
VEPRRRGGRTMGGKQQWWPQLGHHRRGLRIDVRTVRLTSGPHVVFDFFSNLSKTNSILKFKMGVLSCSKNFQFWHAARLGYCKQFSQLCQHPIHNINRAKNPGSDSTFESLMNFKKGLNLLEKSGKFSKILS